MPLTRQLLGIRTKSLSQGVRHLNFGRVWRYWLRDRFLTDKVAPLVPNATLRAAEPGPGAWNAADSQSKMIISGGKLTASSSVSAWQAYVVRNATALARTPGRAFIVEASTSTGQDCTIAWQSTAGELTQYPTAPHNILLNGSAGNVFQMRQPVVLGIGSLVPGTAYEVALIQRSSGVFYLVKGGIYTNWTLLWIDNASTATPLTAGIGAIGIPIIDNWRVVDLPAPFNTDYGIATNRLTSSIGGTLTTQTPDAIIELTFSFGGTYGEFHYRRQDASNMFLVQANPDGSCTLLEKTAGGNTSRGSVASTFVATNTYRLVIIVVGNVHNVYVNNVLKISYTDVSNLRPTATGVLVNAISNGVSELVTWPRTVTIDETGAPILFKETFDYDQNAPLLPAPARRVMEPGPGTWNISDTTNQVSVANNAFQFGTAGAANNPMIASANSFTRAVGRAVLFTATPSSASAEYIFGLGANNTGTTNNTSFRWQASGIGWTVYDSAGALTGSLGALTAGATYECAIVLSDFGQYYMVRGGNYANWTVLWVGQGALGTHWLHARLVTAGFSASFGKWRVTDLGGKWANNYGIATSRTSGLLNTLVTQNHEPDCIIECIVSVLPSTEMNLSFRKIDTNNRWVARINPAGDLKLIEIIAGVENERASASAVIVAGHRLVIVASGSTIAAYSNNVSRWSYASAANFQSATVLEMTSRGGASLNDVTCWPRTTSLPPGV